MFHKYTSNQKIIVIVKPYIMKTKFIFLSTIMSFFAFSGAMAQQDTMKAYNFNLEECIQYAYQHQVAVLNAGLDTRIAEAKVKETIGIGLPQINGTADFTNYVKAPIVLIPDFISPSVYGVLESNNVRDGSGNALQVTTPQGDPEFLPANFQQKYNSNLGVGVTQLLFDGSYIVGLQASKTFKELSQRAFSRSKIETNVAVTKAYYMVLVNNEQINLLDANIAQLKKQLDETKALFDNGFAEKIDADRLTVLYNNLTTERQNVIRSLELGKAMLKFQMGMPVDYALSVKDKIEDVAFERIVPTTDSTAYRNRIEYALSVTQYKLNELDLKRYKSQYLPSLSAFGNASYQFQNNSFRDLYKTDFPIALIGLQLNIPIFSGFQRANRVKQAQYTLEKSGNDLINAKNSINFDIQNSTTNYANSIASLENQKRNLELANEVLRVSKVKYEQGVGSSIEVTQGQTSLKEAENNYINALYQALISKVDIQKATGSIK